MKPKANGTHAKDIALYFLDLIGERINPSVVARTILNVKSLLEHGYTKDEIIRTIDYLVLKKGVNVYSFGYIAIAINDSLRELDKEKVQDEVLAMQKRVRDEMSATLSEKRGDDRTDEESKSRNERKAGRFDSQSRFREKYNLDMFEGKR